jgi:hypothetical protein
LLTAVLSGAVEFNNFPSGGTAAISQPRSIDLPNPFGQATGSVTIMEWTSDGYVLAVGWEHGWAVFSIGGRCLASGFGVEDSVDKTRSVVYPSFFSSVWLSQVAIASKMRLCMVFKTWFVVYSLPCQLRNPDDIACCSFGPQETLN